MELQEIWNLPEKDPFMPTQETIKQTIHSKSKSIMETLRNNLRKKLYFLPACVLLYLVAGFYSTNALLTTLFNIFSIIHFLLMVFGYWQYKSLQPGLTSEHTALSQMQQTCTTIKKTLQVEGYVFMGLLPVMVIASGLFGASLGAGKEIPALLQSLPILITILICLVVAPPLAHLLGKKMNQLAFGQYLEKLEANIRMLEKPE